MFTLRRIRDLPDPLREQLAHLLRDAVAGGASIGFLADLDARSARDYWRDVACELERSLWCWVAELDGRVIGCVQLALCGKPNGRHRAEVQKLMVLREARGRGVARRLMEAAEHAAQAAGRRLLVLDTEVESPAERLYQGLGWQRAGEIPDYACRPDGVSRPTALYWKALGRA